MDNASEPATKRSKLCNSLAPQASCDHEIGSTANCESGVESLGRQSSGGLVDFLTDFTTNAGNTCLAEMEQEVLTGDLDEYDDIVKNSSLGFDNNSNLRSAVN